MSLYRGALQRGRTAFWEAMLAYATKVERVGKGRAAGDAWRELERLIAMVAQPKSARVLGAAG
jgi:DNA polymerase-3 subunit delta